MAEHATAPVSCGEATDLAPGFVLGSLEPAEMARVREHLATCAEAHAEFRELAEVVPAIARSVPPVEAPAALGPRILAAARAEFAQAAETRRAEADAAAAELALHPVPVAAPAPRGAPGSSVRGRLDGLLGGFNRPALGLAAVAAVVAIAVLGAWNLQLRAQVDDLAAYRDGVVAALDAASVPGGQIVVLGQATGTGPNGIAALDPAGKVVVAMRNLPPTTGSEVYEAWVIGASGTPSPVGSFAVAAGGTGTLVTTASTTEVGVTLALTKEPGPGATKPTLPIVVKGQARPATG
jgi:hypothetical protein